MIDLNSIQFRVAKKTVPIRTKMMSSLFTDPSVIHFFLVSTLEGNEPVREDAVLCVGVQGEPWQQTIDKVKAKYLPTETTEDNWTIWVPKPDVSVEFVEVTWESGFIQGHWGEPIDGIPNCQRYSTGDFILRNQDDHSDVWIVRRAIFLNTYTEE